MEKGNSEAGGVRKSLIFISRESPRFLFASKD